MRLFRALVATLVTAVIGACTAVGMAPADTFNKKVASAYALVNTVADSATAAYTAGKLSDADRTNVISTSSAAIAAIGVARRVRAEECPPTAPATCTSAKADDKLTATLTVLTALQSYLATQGAK